MDRGALGSTIIGKGTKIDTLVQVGSAKVSATHDKALPQWAGIAGIVVGAVLALGGFLKKG